MVQRPHIPLEELRAQVQACRRCPLCEGRTQTVFGVGDPNARVLIVGEAPGKNEDLQGEPFVGAAGKYLNELLAVAGLRREDVYIANVLKCRPPGNRNPRVEEIDQCTPFLREQTRTINPEVIVTLGNFATKFILKTEVGITRLRGTVQHAGRFTVLPIFHPAAALYDGSKREALENDFATLGELLGTRPAATQAGAAAGAMAVPGAMAAAGAGGAGVAEPRADAAVAGTPRAGTAAPGAAPAGMGAPQDVSASGAPAAGGHPQPATLFDVGIFESAAAPSPAPVAPAPSSVAPSGPAPTE